MRDDVHPSRPRGEIVQALHAALGRLAGELTVGGVSVAAQVRELWERDAEIYGEDMVPRETLAAWWAAYPPGMHVLCEQGRIAGAFCLWPLRRQSVDRLLGGSMGECDISSDDFASPPACGHWYVSGIFLREGLRGSPAIHFLAGSAISRWLERGDAARRVRICALGYSAQGVALLRRFGFRPVSATGGSAGQWPAYLWEGAPVQFAEEVLRRINPSVRSAAATRGPSAIDPENLRRCPSMHEGQP